MADLQCKYGDPFCPCQDGDQCHYEGENPMTATWVGPDGHKYNCSYGPHPYCDCGWVAEIEGRRVARRTAKHTLSTNWTPETARKQKGGTFGT
jgi:hypothetical protein